MTYDFTTDQLQQQIGVLVDYIRLKIEQADWHGIADAANDIRVIEAQIKVIETIEKFNKMEELP
jgi:hypothetical protein